MTLATAIVLVSQPRAFPLLSLLIQLPSLAFPMSYLKSTLSSPFSFDSDINCGLGLELNSKYQAAAPFPHTVIDDFLSEEVLEYCLKYFPTKLDEHGIIFNRDQERFKARFDPDRMDEGVKSLFYSFNSKPFINVIENLTGISGLVPDPYFVGAGFHEIGQGGHLSIHADFNVHKILQLERRVNVLIYLNKNWQDSYGGQLELWNKEMTECVQSVIPKFNRAVVFNTTADSWHGNPTPVNHPSRTNRRSIALYYYTATLDEKALSKTTQFQVRPKSSDKVDWRVRLTEFVTEFLPPFISRPIVRAMRKYLPY